MASSYNKRSLVKAVILARTVTWTTLILSSLLPAFDSSSALVLNNPFVTFLLRWDAFHFAHIAKEGYVYEHEFFVFPGTPYVMKTVSDAMGLIGLYTENVFENVLVGGAIGSLVADFATIVLYDLTNTTFKSPSFAYLCSLLYLLSSSPATLRNAPYSEPFFAFFSFQGLVYYEERKWLLTSIFFSLATLFRSNGVMLCGFLAWGMLIEPLLFRPKPTNKSHIPIGTVFFCAALCALPLAALGGFQYFAYQSFCIPSATSPWCTQRPPAVYTYVQAKYWNVGIFKYWTVSQIPNFLLAAPVLVLLTATSIYHIRRTSFPQLESLRLGRPFPLSRNLEPILRPIVTPYAIHALALSTTLLTSAHVQIVLRLASSMPFTYWAAGNLWVRSSEGSHDDRSYARWWTTWSVVWGFISLILWGVFLPPA